MSVTIEAPTMDELMQSVNRLDDAVRKSVLTRTVDAGAEIVAAGIGQAAPRSKQSRPPGGRTQTWRTGKHAADNVKRSRPKVTEFEASASVGWDTGANDPYFYMKFFEFGTSSISAKPFMEFGAQQAESEALAAMEQVLREELQVGR